MSETTPEEPDETAQTPARTPTEIAAELEKKATLLDTEWKQADATRKRELAKKVLAVESDTVTGTTELKLDALQKSLPALEKKDLEEAQAISDAPDQDESEVAMHSALKKWGIAAAGWVALAWVTAEVSKLKGKSGMGLLDGVAGLFHSIGSKWDSFTKVIESFISAKFPGLAKMFGFESVVSPEAADTVGEKAKWLLAKGKDKIAEHKEHKLAKWYSEHVTTIVGYMDGLNHSEQTKAFNALSNPKLATLSIDKLQSVVSTNDYAKLAKETEIDEKMLKVVLLSLFCKTPVPVGENYAGYLFQKSLESMSSSSKESVTLQSVIANMQWLLSVGAKVVSGMVEKIKNRDISQESIQSLFQDAFSHNAEWDFSEDILRQNATEFGITKDMIKDIHKNAKIQLDTVGAIGLSKETNEYIAGKLRPFVENIDLSVFEKIHPNISAAKLKTAMKSASIEDVTQLHIIMGWKKFEELSEDAQGLIYMKLWSVAWENRELQWEIGKTLSQDMLGTYVDKFSSSNTGIPEKLRRFMLANCNKAVNNMKNGMSEGFAIAWENIDATTKLKVALYLWLAIFLYARFKFLMGAISFATIMAGLALVAPSAYAALKPHTNEMEQKWNSTIGVK